MNVKSLSNQDKERSVEMRIAKVAFTIFFLFICSWTPYSIISMIGAFGDRYEFQYFKSILLDHIFNFHHSYIFLQITFNS